MADTKTQETKRTLKKANDVLGQMQTANTSYANAQKGKNQKDIADTAKDRDTAAAALVDQMMLVFINPEVAKEARMDTRKI